ncbi:uncharacterized protein LOC141855901 [Brevipalpus obovatus]|uniref:uncharacterized protein LOC141855901 n=1 Tax=Brevipalpus obovatus TaxID=246614 RepID=UPI003D9E207B
MKFIILLVVVVALFAPSQQGVVESIRRIPSKIRHMFDSSSDESKMNPQDKKNTLKPPSYDMKPNHDQSYQIPKPSMDMSMGMSGPKMPSTSMNQPGMPHMPSPNMPNMGMGMGGQMSNSYDSMYQQAPQVKVERKVMKGSDASDETKIETTVTDLRTGKETVYETEIKSD